MSAEPDELLPEGWATALLGDISSELQTGFACGAHNRDGSGVPHLRPMNVNERGSIDLQELKYVPKDEVGRDERWLRKGDVLFNNTNSPELVGKTAFYDLDEPRAFSNHMTRIRFRDGVIPEFYAMLLHQLWREQVFQATCNNHVSQASVSRTALSALAVVVPPTDEQRRIVDAASRVLEKVSSARERLRLVPSRLTRFRESVRAAACSGRLTSDWRVTNPPSQTQEDYRKEVSQQRARLLNGKASTRTPATADADYLGELPEGWGLFSLEELTWVITSGSRDWSKYYGSGTGTFIMAQNVRPGVLDLSFRQAVGPPKDDRDAKRSQVALGDLLVTIVGANTGDLCLVDRDLPEHYVCQSVALLRPVVAAMAPYLNLFFNSGQFGRGQFNRYIYGEGRPHLGFDHLKMSAVALPPSAEQQEITRRVSALFALADTFEQRAKSALRRVEVLPKAVLAKALRGELVPTEAELARREKRSYEPASELLARLGASTSGTPKEKRTRKKMG